MAAAKKDASLSEGVGFATLKTTFPDASARLVELMRATLQHAQEITAAVDEAEAATERAQSAMTIVDTLTTSAERRIVDAEIEKVTNWLNRPPPETWMDKYIARTTNERDRAAQMMSTSSVQPPISSAPSSAIATSTSASAPANVAVAAAPMTPAPAPMAAVVEDSSVETAPAGGAGQGVIDSASAARTNRSASVGGPLSLQAGNYSMAGSTTTASAEMTEEIETTVMWVQQLLESVHFVESEQSLEPGVSLLSIVQPGRRIQKDIALNQSVHLFHEKKEEEEDAEDDAPVFRGSALQTVLAQRLASAGQ